MRQTLTILMVIAATCIPSAAAEKKSWSKIRYVGGSIQLKTSPYDFNTTLTVAVNPDSITLTIAPAKAFTALATVRLKPAQVTLLAAGPAARTRIAEIPGARLPAKRPSLFGLLDEHRYLAIGYRMDNGEPAGVLLDTISCGQILTVLKELTGREVEGW